MSLGLKWWGQAKCLGHGSAACLLGQSGSNIQVGEENIIQSSLPNALLRSLQLPSTLLAQKAVLGILSPQHCHFRKAQLCNF